MKNGNLRNYIGSQEHFEDEVNSFYDKIKQDNDAQHKEIEQEFGNEDECETPNQCNRCGLTDDHSIECPNSN
jgi:hypothetical protein